MQWVSDLCDLFGVSCYSRWVANPSRANSDLRVHLALCQLPSGQKDNGNVICPPVKLGVVNGERGFSTFIERKNVCALPTSCFVAFRCSHFHPFRFACVACGWLIDRIFPVSSSLNEVERSAACNSNWNSYAGGWEATCFDVSLGSQHCEPSELSPVPSGSWQVLRQSSFSFGKRKFCSKADMPRNRKKNRMDRMVVRMVSNFEELDFTCFILLNFRLRHIRPRSMECTLFALARGKRFNRFRLYSLHVNFELMSCLV